MTRVMFKYVLDENMQSDALFFQCPIWIWQLKLINQLIIINNNIKLMAYNIQGGGLLLIPTELPRISFPDFETEQAEV